MQRKEVSRDEMLRVIRVSFPEFVESDCESAALDLYRQIRKRHISVMGYVDKNCFSDDLLPNEYWSKLQYFRYAEISFWHNLSSIYEACLLLD